MADQRQEQAPEHRGLAESLEATRDRLHEHGAQTREQAEDQMAEGATTALTGIARALWAGITRQETPAQAEREVEEGLDQLRHAAGQWFGGVLAHGLGHVVDATAHTLRGDEQAGVVDALPPKTSEE